MALTPLPQSSSSSYCDASTGQSLRKPQVVRQSCSFDLLMGLAHLSASLAKSFVDLFLPVNLLRPVSARSIVLGGGTLGLAPLIRLVLLPIGPCSSQRQLALGGLTSFTNGSNRLWRLERSRERGILAWLHHTCWRVCYVSGGGESGNRDARPFPTGFCPIVSRLLASS